jgi:ribulose-phosphate 3-epimerase
MAASLALGMLKGLVPTLSVGMLTADLLSLGSEMSLLEQTDVKVIHFDVMDGRFCPMMTVGPPIIRAVKTPLLKDVHLMIQDPLEKVGDYIASGADMITVHVESCLHIHRLLQIMGKMTNANDSERGLIRGVALNPGTPVGAIEPLLDEVEMVMLLAINPGWGGQQFAPSTRHRLQKVRQMIAGLGKDILVGVDGGVTRENIADVASMGADIVVSGSAVFDGKAPVENAKFMLNALRG